MEIEAHRKELESMVEELDTLLLASRFQDAIEFARKLQAEEPALGNDHRFCVCDQEGAPVVGALALALWAARPQCLPSFSALRFRAGDHIGCRDDRAQVEVLAKWLGM